MKLKPLLLLALAISSVEARSSLLNLASFGGTSSYAASVNEHGSVTGAIKFSSNETRAFVLSKNGSIRFLDDLGGNLTQGWGINDQDTVVGMGKDNFLYVRAIKATTGGATENLGSLDRFGAIAFAINESGLIVGASVGLRQNQRATVFDPVKGPTDLNIFGSNGRAQARDVNNTGQIAGFAQLKDSSLVRAFVTTLEGEADDLGTLGGTQSLAYGINQLGQITGMSYIKKFSSDYHAFVYRNDGSMRSIHDSNKGYSSIGFDINNKGQVVGQYQVVTGEPPVAFYFDGKKTSFLCDIVDCAGAGFSSLRNALAINDEGVIVGEGITQNGELQGYVLSVSALDSDSDGLLNTSDNCQFTPNPDQADLDGDNIGDACDTDVDGDSVEDNIDNCPLVANSDQLDVDGDLIGDACDDLIDNDADGVANDLDNCPAVPNADQADNDGDLFGDACDLDDDNDGVEDTLDNCSLTANENQADNDSDNIGDVCDSDDDNDAIEDDLDNCPLIANVSQDDNDGDGFGDVCDPDDDNDAVDDSVDNCPLSFNPDQSNTDGVGAGDACNDAFDVDDDDWENDYDNCPDVANRNQSDFDYDNIGDACDSDVDGDEVANAADACELTPLGELVGSIGCSIEQLCPCDAPRQSTEPWKNHGQYVSCMTKAAQSFAADGVISGNEKSDLVNAAAQSSCGY